MGPRGDHFRPKNRLLVTRPSDPERLGSDPAPNDPPKLIFTDFSRFLAHLEPLFGGFCTIILDLGAILGNFCIDFATPQLNDHATKIVA